jgi:hypothetical protein
MRRPQHNRLLFFGIVRPCKRLDILLRARDRGHIKVIGPAGPGRVLVGTVAGSPSPATAYGS